MFLEDAIKKLERKNIEEKDVEYVLSEDLIIFPKEYSQELICRICSGVF